jgi:hypothetical protein
VLDALWAYVFLAGTTTLLIVRIYDIAFRRRAVIEVLGAREIYTNDLEPAGPTVALFVRIAMALLLACGIWGLTAGSARPLRWRRVAFAIMVVMTANLQFDVFRSGGAGLEIAALFAHMALGSVVVLGAAFIASREESWERVQRWLPALVAVSCLATIQGLFLLRSAGRMETRAYLHEPGLLLEVAGVVGLGVKTGKRWGWLRYVPLVLLGVNAVVTQTRLVGISLLVAVAAYLFARRQAMASLAVVGILVGGLTAYVVLSRGAVLNPEGGGVLEHSVAQLQQRMTEDTRSDSLRDFFVGSNWRMLIFGVGMGEGFMLEHHFLRDFGYLHIMLVGGIPALALFVYCFVVPVMKAGRSQLAREDAAVFAGAVAFCVRMTSSTAVTAEPYVIVGALLCLRCAVIAARSRARSARVAFRW